MAAHALKGKRPVAAAWAAAAVLLTPAAALACPYCAGQSGGGTARLVLLGAFVFFPYVVVTAILRIIKAGSRDA